MSLFQMAVIPVPTENKTAYADLSVNMTRLFKEYGARQMFEGWGAMVPPGEVTSLPRAVQLKEDETVVASFIEWPDAETAGACMAAMRTDDRFAKAGKPPFDGSRMIFGTFETLLKL